MKRPVKQRELSELLLGPERGWFRACRAWVDGGPPLDDFLDAVKGILSFLDEFQRAVADAHLEAARLAWNAHWCSGDTVESDGLDARILDRWPSDRRREVGQKEALGRCQAVDVAQAQPPNRNDRCVSVVCVQDP